MSRKVIYIDFKCTNNKKPFLNVFINRIKNCFIKTRIPEQVEKSNNISKVIDYDKYILWYVSLRGVKMRIGSGYDVHKLIEGRKLIIGGVHIPYLKGLLGHSDADVLIHSIMDSLLGAMALGDIGKHFPDTDQSLKGIDSKILLKKVISLVDLKGYKIGNIDSTLCLEKPKIISYVEQMREIIAGICHINTEDISIKATTNEKMGFIGREDGVAAYAVALMVKI